MKTKIALYLILALTIFSCDKATEDVKPNLEVVIETGPGVPVLLSPDQLINDFARQFNFKHLPDRGQTNKVVDGKFLKYIPDDEFVDGEDRFSLKLIDEARNEREVNVTVKVTDDPCNYGPAFDYIEVKVGESTTIDLLANDLFCGVIPPFDIVAHGRRSDVFSRHSLSSTYQGSLLDSLSFFADPFKNRADLTINAPMTPGRIEIIYEIGFVMKPEYFSGNDWMKPEGGLLPKAFEYYMLSEAIIEFVD